MSPGGSTMASFEDVNSFLARDKPPDQLIRTYFEQIGVVPKVVFNILEKLVLLLGRHPFNNEIPCVVFEGGVIHIHNAFVQDEHLVNERGNSNVFPKTKSHPYKTSSFFGSYHEDSTFITPLELPVALHSRKACDVPVTAEDDKIHGYNVPSDDCFAHLEVQFRFSGLSDNVEGVLGKTYQPDFKNPAKPGVAMAVVGGEDKYKTSGLLSSDCAKCIFDSGNVGVIAKEVIALDCSAKGYFHGNGIVCKK
ncbi:root cap [Tanacetum coccineum]